MRSPTTAAANARTYLAGRGMGGDVPKRWGLGFAPGGGALVRHLGGLGFKPKEMVDANVALERDGKLRDRFYNRVMFPIRDVQGECIAFGGRIVGEGQPKYLNSQETPLFHKSQVLFGLDRAKAALASTGVAVVVEGYTDVIALSEEGVGNVVATLGTALTRQHIRLLSRHAQRRIVYLFDGDEAGQRAADRALGFIDDSMTPEAGRSQTELAAVTLPDDLDPAEFVAARGAQELQRLIDGAQPLLKYGIDRRLAAHDLSRAEGRAAALSDALAVLAPIKDSLLAKDYAVQIAGRVRAREQDVLDELARLVPPRRDAETNEGPASGAPARGSGGPSPARSPLPGTASAQGAPSESRQAAGGRAGNLPQAELNRRRFEREFLSLLAQHPDLALAHAGALAQTQWHERAACHSGPKRALHAGRRPRRHGGAGGGSGGAGAFPSRRRADGRDHGGSRRPSRPGDVLGRGAGHRRRGRRRGRAALAAGRSRLSRAGGLRDALRERGGHAEGPEPPPHGAQAARVRPSFLAGPEACPLSLTLRAARGSRGW